MATRTFSAVLDRTQFIKLQRSGKASARHELSHYNFFGSQGRMASLFQIFLKLPSGTSMTLEVSERMRIKDLKEMVHKERGLPVTRQRLVFAGKPLSDDASLMDYNITRVTAAAARAVSFV